jgi:hypothetical protein
MTAKHSRRRGQLTRYEEAALKNEVLFAAAVDTLTSLGELSQADAVRLKRANLRLDR